MNADNAGPLVGMDYTYPLLNRKKAAKWFGQMLVETWFIGFNT